MSSYAQSWTYFFGHGKQKNTDRYPAVLLVSIDSNGRLDSAITRYMPILLIQCHLDFVPLFGLPFSLPPYHLAIYISPPPLFLFQKSMFMNLFFIQFQLLHRTDSPAINHVIGHESYVCCVMSWFQNQLFDHLDLDKRVLVKTNAINRWQLHYKIIS